MGLDQYFFKKKRDSVEALLHEEDDDNEVGYFRKCNMLRSWMIMNAGYPAGGNCIDHPVSKETLEKLVVDCDKVLAVKNEKASTNKARNVCVQTMPTQSGFLFGSTEYDERYFNDVKNIKDTVQSIINSIDFEKEEIVYHEWW